MIGGSMSYIGIGVSYNVFSILFIVSR